MTAGTIWRFICPCGREHEYKRPVVSVDFLNDARRARDEIAAAAEAWDQTLSSYCDGLERDALRRAVTKARSLGANPNRSGESA